MKELTRMGVEELRKVLPVLDDAAQKKVYGGSGEHGGGACGDYGNGTDNSQHDCLYQVLGSFLGKLGFNIETDYASFLVSKKIPASDAYRMAAEGVRSSDVNDFLAQYGFSSGYSTSGGDNPPACGDLGIAILATKEGDKVTGGHAVKILKRVGPILYCEDVQKKENIEIWDNDASIYALYTKN